MTSEFDGYAANYDNALNQGLSLSGEAKEYFVRERVRWVGGQLNALGAPVSRVLDYGCGTGGTSPELLGQLRARVVVGVDSSSESLDVARNAHTHPWLRFENTTDLQPAEEFDLVYCNGVFHQIEPDQRLESVRRRVNVCIDHDANSSPRASRWLSFLSPC